MKSQTKILGKLLLGAIFLIFMIAGCKQQDPKMQSERDQLKMQNDSLAGLLSNWKKGEEEMGEEKMPKCLVEIEKDTAIKMANNFKPSTNQKEHLRGGMIYWWHAKYLYKNFKSHIHISYAFKDKGHTIYILVVQDNSKKWHYFTVDSKCMEPPPTDNNKESADSDTVSGPKPCTPCTNCPPCPFAPCTCCNC